MVDFWAWSLFERMSIRSLKSQKGHEDQEIYQLCCTVLQKVFLDEQWAILKHQKDGPSDYTTFVGQHIAWLWDRSQVCLSPRKIGFLRLTHLSIKEANNIHAWKPAPEFAQSQEMLLAKQELFTPYHETWGDLINKFSSKTIKTVHRISKISTAF